jgi:hypothetical protein
MGFFSFLNRSNKNQDENPETRNILPEIREEDFIDNSEPSEVTKSSQFIKFGSDLPIDIIYDLLKEDYETKAYKDALTNPDRSYKEKNIAILRSTLDLKFKQVTLKYDDMLREIEVHIKTRGEAGLPDLVELLKSRKETYLNHKQTLEQMKDDLNNEEHYMIGIFTSYDVGFTRGLASLSLHNLKMDNAL